jgi:O-antigen ligase
MRTAIYIPLGALATVLVVTTFHAFELDRFFVPKELALHLTALGAGFAAMRLSRFERVDVFLALYLLVSAVSAVFATNPWLAMRAVAISASSALLFWGGRTIAEAGYGPTLIRGLALAVIAAAATSLLQTYGVDAELFSEQRAPGGTLGNRNFVAHVAAFGFPLLLFTALRARRYWLWSAGAALVVASLVLTRSRAAWLAFGAVVVVSIVTMRREHWRRFGGMVVLSAVAVAAVLVIPNALRWRSDNPYLETMRRVADYGGGSGRGRLVQYQHSLLMAARHPLLGAGPGNWAVAYPAFASRTDPSMNDATPGMTYNPWPSSDWIANVSERGITATVLLALVFLSLALRRDPMCLAMIAGVVVAGMFDAVLLLAVPAVIVWPALGACGAAGSQPADFSREPGGLRARRSTLVLVIIMSLLGGARSAAQLVAMHTYTTRSDRTSLAQAARIDPGNFRLQLRLARGGKGRCEHARAAHALYPHAQVARGLSGGCGE